jgi:hypothetical protein
MLAIADQCEERGDVHLAAGWRWLARRKKHPGHAMFWSWAGYIRVQKNGEFPVGTWQLPGAAVSYLESLRPRMGRKPLDFDSCSEAFQRAAEAMAVLSQQGIDIENLEKVND